MPWSALLLQEPDAVAALLMQDGCMSKPASMKIVHSDTRVGGSAMLCSNRTMAQTLM